MPTTSFCVEIGSTEIELDIEYSITGEFRPATFWHPEETADLEIEAVTYNDQPLPQWMADLLKDEIEQAAWFDHDGILRDRAEAREDAMADAADAYRQELKDRRWAA